MNAEELRELKQKLKMGEYDGVEIMQAWIAIEELANLKESMGSNQTQWISVKDKLPPIGEHVILYDGFVQNETYSLIECEVDGIETMHWVINHVDCIDDRFEVGPDDLWMPLPEPPEQN